MEASKRKWGNEIKYKGEKSTQFNHSRSSLRFVSSLMPGGLQIMELFDKIFIFEIIERDFEFEYQLLLLNFEKK